jgi:hypothetical protein
VRLIPARPTLRGKHTGEGGENSETPPVEHDGISHVENVGQGVDDVAHDDLSNSGIGEQGVDVGAGGERMPAVPNTTVPTAVEAWGGKPIRIVQS